MFVRELSYFIIFIIVLHISICYGFDYDESGSEESIEENFKNNPGFHHIRPIDYHSTHENRDDGRVIFPDYEELTYTTQNPQSLQACLRSCEVIGDEDPVCGTNGVTYKNLNQLQCAAKCGVDVQFRHYTPCPSGNELMTSTEPTNKVLCVSKCPTTPEFNPVCGTDNVTYKNQGKLLCAQMCGIAVQVKRPYPCPKKRITTTESSLPIISPQPRELSRDVKDCIHECPATSEYSPVCGSDGRTYYNYGKLQCARHCGVDVSVYRRSRCTMSS